MSIMPNFIVIGAAKCGTSSVCGLLGSHPDVFMSDPKEPAFFSRREGFEELRSWYADLFRGAEGRHAIGEGSTLYTHPDVIELSASRISREIPECRLIYMIRHPIHRLESDWKMRYQEGWTPDSINQAVAEQPNLVKHGLYWTNLNVYRRYFRDEQIVVCLLEDFAREPLTELRRMFLHLGVDLEVILRDVDRPRNKAGDRLFRKGVLRVLRRWPGFAALREATPSWLVDSLRPMFTVRRSLPTVQWDPTVRERVAGALRDDAAEILGFLGKPPDLWDLRVPGR